ncbi:MAG: hypothetical protein JWO77_147 [Ilumatobacteraceae bacterium]|nr:hypothetical protein [Ilumatobacteraceae bacterium]
MTTEPDQSAPVGGQAAGTHRDGSHVQRAALRALAFDRLAASAVLLDRAGEIVETNESWRLFAALNGGHPETTGVGVSYLEVCRRAAAMGSDAAAAVASGLEEVLAGRRAAFEHEYPCPSPDEDRWFRLTAVAGSIGSLTGVVVWHADITSVRVLEEGLAGQVDRDRMTGLATGTSAERALHSWLDAGGRAVLAVSICMHGIDEIEAEQGRHIARQLQVQVANRLRRLRPGDAMMCRIAEGRFLALVPDAGRADGDELVAAAGRALRHPFQVGAAAVALDATIGFATCSTYTPAATLFEAAHAGESVDPADGGTPAVASGPDAEADLRPTVVLPGSSDAAPIEPMIAELRAAQATTNAVLAHATDLVMFFSGDGTIEWISPACRRLFGVTPESLVGANGFELIVSEDRERVLRDFLTVPNLGDSVRTEFRIIDADGRMRWVEEVVTNLIDEPDVGAVVGHLRDITARREAEAAVQLQARLLAAAGQAIVARDQDDRVIYWNQAAEALYGWSADEARGRLMSDLVTPAKGWSERSAQVAQAFTEGRSWSGELVVVAKSGEALPVSATGTPVTDESGAQTGTIVVSADISDQIAGRAAAARLAAVVDSSSDAIISADAAGVITTWNNSAAELFGYDAGEADGMLLGRLVSEAHADLFDRAFRQVVDGERIGTQAIIGRRRDDTSFYASIALSPIPSEAGEVGGVSMIARDVTESIERRLEAEEDRKRLADAQASAGLGSFEIDLRTGAVTRSDELWKILGRPPGPTPIDLLACVHPDDAAPLREAFAAAVAGHPVDSFTHRIVRPDGTIRWVVSQVTRNAGRPERLSGTTLDITERHLAELALAHQANHDPLTGLANRRLFIERLDSALERDLGTGSRTAVLFIDLDDFKAVNDRMGHHGGDTILQATGQLIDGILDDDCTVARFGGDEFVVCCENIGDLEEVHRTVERIRAALRTPFRTPSESFTVTTSIGVALSGPTSHADALVRDADAAMYAAKQQGPGRVEVFDQTMTERSLERRARIAELQVALANGEITTFFQPEIELRTGQLIGFEALARWHHPERGSVSPAEFIPLAESSGLIDELGRRVLADACAALASWIERRPELALTVSVNVSTLQMAGSHLADDVRSVIAAAGVPPGRVCLEVTESALMDPVVAADALRSLKSVGVLIAVDDFGTGYSSLSRLKRFPVDFLKIDRSFTAGLGREPEDELIVRAVADLAHSLGVQVIAEGIETEAQMQMLAAMNCEFGQGFLWSQAVASDDVWALLDHSHRFAPEDGASAADRPRRDGTLGLRATEASHSLALLVHELGSPLAVASGYAELLRTSPEFPADSDAAAHLVEITTALNDITAITTSLQDTRPMAEGTLSLQREDFDIVPLLQELAEAMGLPTTGDGPAVRGERVAPVHADPTRMRQVFRNLLSNAAKWQATETWIEVATDPEGRFVTVSVVDDGPGVPSERTGDLFRRFVRLDTRMPGTGLGLYISRNLARAHGGDIRYLRTAGGGSEFAVDIPRSGT